MWLILYLYYIFDRVFEKTYSPAVMPYECLSDAETIRVREAVQSLRQSYQPQYANEACVSRYHTEENRKAYMLAYYPYYVEPACRVVRDYVIPALQERQAFYPVLNLAFFAGGPCPEMYGTLKALRGAQLHDRTAITILDWECGWESEQQISWQLCQEDGLVRCGDEGRLIYCCDNLAPCEQCMHGRTCRKRIQEQADVYFLQNYLSHVEPTEQETFLDKMRATVEQAKPGAVFVIIDLQYAGSKAIMRELAARVQAEWDVPAEVIGTNLFTGARQPGAAAPTRCLRRSRPRFSAVTAVSCPRNGRGTTTSSCRNSEKRGIIHDHQCQPPDRYSGFLYTVVHEPRPRGLRRRNQPI